MKALSIGMLTGVALATSGIVLGSSHSASADVLWDWSYQGTNVAGGSGTFTTTDVFPGGSYLITGITGNSEGDTITSLIAPGGFEANDNILFANFPQLQSGGFAFRTALGPVNINYLDGYNYEFEGGILPISFTATVVEDPVTVPESSSLLGYITLGSLMIGSAVRRAKQFNDRECCQKS